MKTYDGVDLSRKQKKPKSAKAIAKKFAQELQAVIKKFVEGE